jgi:phosphate transport system substrate-binding protein
LSSSVTDRYTSRPGTGGGFEKFCRGEIEIQNASRPITPRERTACEQSSVNFIEVPVAYDAVTIIVHPTNDWASCMTMPELKRLWEPIRGRKGDALA